MGICYWLPAPSKIFSPLDDVQSTGIYALRIAYYNGLMIKSFADKSTLAVFKGYFARGLPQDIQLRASSKLRQLDAACTLDDLRNPPANHLELLKGNRSGQWSIRVNQQWRICFRWEAGNVYDVELVDYH